MKSIDNYLDDLKEKTGSDNKSAIALNLDRSAISNIRKRGLMSDETALKLADYLEIDRDEVLLAATLARSTGEVKTAWLDHAKKAGLAASLALLINGPSDIVEASGQVYRLPNMYIMSNFKAWIFRFLGCWSGFPGFRAQDVLNDCASAQFKKNPLSLHFLNILI